MGTHGDFIKILPFSSRWSIPSGPLKFAFLSCVSPRTWLGSEASTSLPFPQPTPTVLKWECEEGLVSKGNSVSHLPPHQRRGHIKELELQRFSLPQGTTEPVALKWVNSPPKAFWKSPLYPHGHWFITVSSDLSSLFIKSIKLPFLEQRPADKCENLLEVPAWEWT